MESNSLEKNACGDVQHEPKMTKLKCKLTELVAICKQLQDDIGYLENKEKRTKVQGDQTAAADVDANKAYESLKEKMKELVSMNLNWQKFSTQQERLIQSLKETISQLEHELKTRNTGQLPESQQIEFDQLLLAKKQQCNSLEEEKIKVEDENHQLKLKLDAVEMALNESNERSQLLEQQLVLYQEDFKKERADRERAQAKIAELEMMLKDVHWQQTLPVQTTSLNQFADYNSSMHGDLLRGRGLYQTDGNGGFSSSPKSSLGMKNFVGHSGQQNQPSINLTPRVNQFDGVDKADGLAVDLTGPSNNHFVLSDMLSCPNCRKVFTRDHHLELVEHMEDCY